MKAPKFDPKIGPNVRAWRENRGWTQEDLIAQVVKRGYPMTASTLSRIEGGKITNFREQLLVIFERIFGIRDIRQAVPPDAEARG